MMEPVPKGMIVGFAVAGVLGWAYAGLQVAIGNGDKAYSLYWDVSWLLLGGAVGASIAYFLNRPSADPAGVMRDD